MRKIIPINEIKDYEDMWGDMAFLYLAEEDYTHVEVGRLVQDLAFTKYGDLPELIFFAKEMNTTVLALLKLIEPDEVFARPSPDAWINFLIEDDLTDLDGVINLALLEQAARLGYKPTARHVKYEKEFQRDECPSKRAFRSQQKVIDALEALRK